MLVPVSCYVFFYSILHSLPQDTNESIYEKYDPLLHGNTRSKKDQILSTKFMRKFIHIARFIKPKLTQEASDAIADEYAKLRNQDMMESDVARVSGQSLLFYLRYFFISIYQDKIEKYVKL